MFNLNVTRNQMKLHHTFNIIKFLFYFNIFFFFFYFTYYLIDKFKKYSSLQFNKFINNDYSSITIYNDFLNVYNHFYGLQYIILFIILNLIIINFINKSYKYHNKILHKLDYPTYDELKKEGTIDNINKCDEEEEKIIDKYINNNENVDKENNNNKNVNKENKKYTNKKINNHKKINNNKKINNQKFNKLKYKYNPNAKEFKPKYNKKYDEILLNEDKIINNDDNNNYNIKIILNEDKLKYDDDIFNNIFDNILLNIDNKLNNFY